MHNSSRGGSARTSGANQIPVHLREKGVIEHPGMKKYLKNIGTPDAPCGIMAFLLGYAPELYKPSLEKLIVDAAMYGSLIGLESNYMTNGDFDKLLDLDEFMDYRVIVFTREGKIDYSKNGDNWEWDPELLRTDPDPKSIYILLDNLDRQNKHYWWVAFIKSLVFPKGADKKCFVCFHKGTGRPFDEHVCFTVLSFQCKICKFNFTSKESLNDHRSRSTEEFKCDCCTLKKFNGYNCFERHERENCNPPPGFTRLVCVECNKYYTDGRVHDCSFGSCEPCNHIFTDKTDFKNHRCYMEHGETFWEPVTEKVFKCHFAYDYETCNEIVQEDSEEEIKEFKQEVMAWAVQLMLPCDETRRYVMDFQFREKIIEKIDNSPNDVKNDIQYEMLPTGSIRIQGIFFIFLL